MKKVTEFCKKNKYAIVWTACYIMVMWAVLFWMFNFNMFNAAQWQILMHAELRGFPGFVFGILILAAIPLYIATTSIIVRTKKPLFTIPFPKIKIPKKTQPQAVPAAQSTATKQNPAPTEPEKAIPSEMRAMFNRARTNGTIFQKSVFDPSITTPAPTQTVAAPELESAPELPLPSNFDTPTTDTVPSFTPVFSDINFDEPQQPTPSDTITDENIPVAEYLFAQQTEFISENGVILTARDAIATHNDPDFWIADNETWFASGKQKPSPADTVLSVGTAHGLRPVLYLAQTNILDLDARRAKWESDGITVITNLDELK